jgi:hypothetical protein
MEPARAHVRVPFRICGGIPFVNSGSDETGHAIDNRFRQMPVAGDADFLSIPQRRHPGSYNLVAA